MLSGLIVRLLVAPFTGHGWDMYVWLKSGELFLYSGTNIYEISDVAGFPWGFYAYPPLWLYWLAAAQLLTTSFSLSINEHIILIKLPIIISDILSGYLLYLLLLRLRIDEKLSIRISILFLFNPLIIFVSSVWGMFDSIATLFVLLSLLLLMKNHDYTSILLLGIGAAIKIYPALLLPCLLIYIYDKKRKLIKSLIMGCLIFSLPLIIFSFPYLFSLNAYITKLFYHTSNIGQFNIWTLITPLLSTEISTIISMILFVTFYGYYIIKNRGVLSLREHSVKTFTAILAVFLATSIKVNVQYLTWIIPLMLIELAVDKYRRKFNTTSFIIINLMGIVFIAAFSQLISFDLGSLGRVNSLVVSENFVVGGLILSSAGVAGWRFILMMLEYLGLSRVKEVLTGKIGVSLILILLLLSLSLFPSPVGIELPRGNVRIAVPESVHSLFIDGDVYLSSDEHKRLASFNIIVFPFSLDFFNQYEGYVPDESVNNYMKFRIDTSELRMSHLRRIVRNLKSNDIRVLIGVFISPRQELVSYGIHGYSSEWLINNHPEVIKNGKVHFGEIINESNRQMKYSSYIAGKIARVIEDFDFDGLYILTEPEGIRTINDVDAIMPLIIDARKELGIDKIVIIDRVDPFLPSDALIKIMTQCDYVVLHTSPWIDGMQYGTRANRTIEMYYQRIKQLKEELPSKRWSQLLYSIYTLDMTSGWLTPALEIQLEVDTYSNLLNNGYSIYYASRYLPYRLNLRES